MIAWVCDQLIDVTDPGSPVAVGNATHGVGGFTELEGARGAQSVDIITVSECTYAVVASWADNGVQLLNVTDPSVPAPVDAVTDGERGFTELLGAAGIKTFAVGSHTFAIAVAQQDNGVQLINLVIVVAVYPYY